MYFVTCPLIANHLHGYGSTNPRSRGCAPARRLHFFARPKKRSKEIRPTSLPAGGGFPPFHSCFEEWQKLGLRLKHLPLSPQISCSIPAASHGDWWIISKFILINNLYDKLLKLAPFWHVPGMWMQANIGIVNINLQNSYLRWNVSSANEYLKLMWSV